MKIRLLYAYLSTQEVLLIIGKNQIDIRVLSSDKNVVAPII